MNQHHVAIEHHPKAVNKFTSDDRWFSAIGRFIFEFSQLEYTLKHYVAEKVGLDDVHFNSIMTHDFAILCNIAEVVLPQEPKRPDWHFPDAPDTPRKNKVKKDYQTERIARAKKLKRLINGCRKLNDDRV